VVVDREWDTVNEPNASAQAGGAGLLDAWIAARYEPVYASGPLAVLAPRPEGRP
jgi:hypothetical protein